MITSNSSPGGPSSALCVHPSCYRVVGSMAEPSGVRGHPLSCGRTICDAWAEGHDAGHVAEAKRWLAAGMTDERRALASRAIASMAARKDEDVGEWAKKLAADSVAAGDIETEIYSQELTAEDYEKSRKELYQQATDLEARAKVLETRFIAVVDALISIRQRAYGVDIPEIEMPMGNRLQAIGSICELTIDDLRGSLPKGKK